MENEYNPWTMFHSTDMGDNLEEVVETEGWIFTSKLPTYGSAVGGALWAGRCGFHSISTTLVL